MLLQFHASMSNPATIELFEKSACLRGDKEPASFFCCSFALMNQFRNESFHTYTSPHPPKKRETVEQEPEIDPMDFVFFFTPCVPWRRRWNSFDLHFRIGWHLKTWTTRLPHVVWIHFILLGGTWELQCHSYYKNRQHQHHTNAIFHSSCNNMQQWRALLSREEIPVYNI